ncbi:tetratricopeptide repeat protein, partial [Clostridioides difficile]|uniref:tetratricopeptide repeat protein n=1 Tax=Clostridioides difficile TaxID=1496 RepID=UPI002A917481
LKSEKKTKSSIQLYKKVADIGENKGNTSEATYQVAILSEKLKDYKTAEEYYKMYVENYSEKDAYFDESYYNLGMMYYNNGDLKNSKLTLKKLVNKVPNSMYNKIHQNKHLFLSNFLHTFYNILQQFYSL